MRRTTRRWVRALGLAAITGSRTALGPALAFGGSGRRLSLCTRVMAALDMLADKHPRAANRTAPLGLGFRIASAATVVRAVLKRRHGRAAGAGALVLGAAVAVAGALVGIRLRRALTRLLGDGPRANALAGAIEDLALIAAGRRLVAVR